MGLLKKRPAILVRDGRAKEIEDWVAAEGSYDLYINDTMMDTIVVSPTDLEVHAVGYVVTEGIVDSKEVKEWNDTEIKSSSIRQGRKGFRLKRRTETYYMGVESGGKSH